MIGSPNRFAVHIIQIVFYVKTKGLNNCIVIALFAIQSDHGYTINNKIEKKYSMYLKKDN